jgi:hypothetical protein
MKSSPLWLGFLLPAICLGEGILHKTAVLVLPDQIECRSGVAYYLSGEIGLRWDGTDPLKINVWRNSKSGKPDQLLCDLDVFDEAGRKVEQQFFVSIPPMPEGEMVIERDKYKQLRFFIWNGGAVFPRPGNYCAIATFDSAWTGKTNVVFTTNKRWFKVVEAPPKPKKT